MAEPLISVVMSVFNNAAFLPRAIDSVLAQTCPEFEFIIIDDGSRDGSREIITDYAGRDKRIKPISQENSGLVNSLNRGLGKARGEYLARMDGDDICFPHRFEAQVAALEARPGLGAVGGDVTLVDRAGLVVGQQVYPRGHQLKERLLCGSLLCHPCVMLRTGVLRELGGYRPYYAHCEDYDLWLRLSRLAELDNLPDKLLYYRTHDGSVTARYKLVQVLGTLIAQGAYLVSLRTGRDITPQLPPVSPGALEGLPLSAEEREGLYLRLLPRYFQACWQTGKDPRADQFALRCLAWLMPRLKTAHGRDMHIFTRALEQPL